MKTKNRGDSVTMRKFANHILAVAYEHTLSVSNLQLHKVMYFVMRKQKDNYELLSGMYDEPFYVWGYGPIVPSIYAKYCGYGSRAIIEKGERTNEYSVFDDSIIKLLKEDLFTLIDKSREHKYWLQNKDKIANGISTVKYELNDVLE